MGWRRQTIWRTAGAAVLGVSLAWVGLRVTLPERTAGSAGAGVPWLEVKTPESVADTVLQERLTLLDPTPLFLPSPMSSGRQGIDAQVNINFSDEALRDFAPRLMVADWARGGLDLSAVGGNAYGPAEAIGQGELRFPFLGMGRRVEPVSSLPGRWAVAAVYGDRKQGVQKEFALPASVSSATMRSVLWAPMELMVTVAPDGLLGDPELCGSSGVSEVDDYVIDVVRSVCSMGGDLKPGTYWLVVAP